MAIPNVPPDHITNRISVESCPVAYRLRAVEGRHQLVAVANAVSVGDGRHVLTTAHALPENTRLELSDATGQSWPVRSIVKTDAERDLAWLRVGWRSPVLPQVPPMIGAALPGRSIVVQAHIPNVGYLPVSGTVLPASRLPFVPQSIVISVPLVDGMSGAPVLDHQCRLLGIAAYGLEGHEHHYFALPVEESDLFVQ